jgi:5-methylcytosine-specific restriction endonuclease McrA
MISLMISLMIIYFNFLRITYNFIRNINTCNFVRLGMIPLSFFINGTPGIFELIGSYILHQPVSLTMKLDTVCKDMFIKIIDTYPKKNYPYFIDPTIYKTLSIDNRHEKISYVNHPSRRTFYRNINMTIDNTKIIRFHFVDDAKLILDVTTIYDNTFQGINKLIKGCSIIINKTIYIEYEKKPIEDMTIKFSYLNFQAGQTYVINATKKIGQTKTIAAPITPSIELLIPKKVDRPKTISAQITSSIETPIPKKRRKQLPKATRVAVWNTYIGEGKGESPCFVGCGNTIYWSNYECGHVVASSMGGSDEINNLRPICSNCNKSMGTENMDDFIKEYGFKLILINKAAN